MFFNKKRIQNDMKMRWHNQGEKLKHGAMLAGLHYTSIMGV